MIGLKQLAGVVASLLIMVSGAVLQTSDDPGAGAVALQTTPGGGSALLADAPAPLSISNLYAFDLSTSQGQALPPALIEGGIETISMVTSTAHPPVRVELGNEVLTLQPGSKLKIQGFDGALSLGEDELATIVTATGVARALHVTPAPDQPVTTTGASNGIPAERVLVDGQEITGNFRQSGAFDTIVARLVPPTSTVNDEEIGLIAGVELLPIEQDVTVQFEDFIGLVVTVQQDRDTLQLRLDGFANVTAEGGPSVFREVSHEQEVDLSGDVPTPGNQAPVANFTWTPQVPTEGETVDFIDQSDDELMIKAWRWDFGDGNTSTDQHPSHTFTEPGTYAVNLTVEDLQGAEHSRIHEVTVSIHRPEVSFSWTPVVPVEAESIQFTATAEDERGDPVTTFRWHFPDGTVLTGDDVTWSFSLEGEYDVSLEAEDASGVVGWHNRTINVKDAPPNPDFIVIPANPTAGEPVTLQSTSTDPGQGAIVNTSWHIRDIPGIHYGEEIDVSFPHDGDVWVRMVVTDDEGQSVSLERDVTVLNPSPSVRISQTPPYPNPQETVTFVAHVEDDDPSPASAIWSFPGGIERSGLAVNHRFAAGGLNEISVTVTDPDGASTTTTKLVRVNQPPIAGIQQTESVVHTGEPVTFSANVLDPDGNQTSVSWLIDGQHEGNTTSITRAWDDDGNHSVRLTVTDTAGAVTRNVTSVLILNRPPTLNPTMAGTANLGERIQLTANAEDADGTITRVQWFDLTTDTLLGTGEQINPRLLVVIGWLGRKAPRLALNLVRPLVWYVVLAYGNVGCHARMIHIPEYFHNRA
ncbi:MAG: PKD domain-containing protein, partial [Candidatus Thermoplasmatota archaeon]|nr:PKD domain-containing protein [Candidatus Thermoplasmatota archaeon]